MTLADNSKMLCVKVGTAIEVLLRGTAAERWTAVHASSTALVPRPDPRMTLMVGVTGAAYTATRPGVVILSSTRPVCPPPTAPRGEASTPVARCGAMLAFRVSLEIVPDSQHG